MVMLEAWWCLQMGCGGGANDNHGNMVVTWGMGLVGVVQW